jgi:hypothetical protein
MTAVVVVATAAVLTGARWRVVVDSGGASAGNPISHYGPHWLYPTIAATVLVALIAILLMRTHRLGIAIALTAFAAGAASNLAEWLILGGVSNPIGPLPGVHGSGYASVGDACLWVGTLAAIGHGLLAPAVARRRTAVVRRGGGLP